MSDRDDLIKFKIKGRTINYFLTSESDLNEIKSKSFFADIFAIICSIFVGGIVSIVITKASTTLDASQIKVVNLMLYFFVGISILTGILAGYFYKSTFDIIKTIKESGEIKSLNSDQTSPTGLVILSALYWTPKRNRDVAEILNKKVKENRLATIANNSLDPDPNFDPEPGVAKKLTVTYKYNGITLQREYNEHSPVELP